MTSDRSRYLISQIRPSQSPIDSMQVLVDGPNIGVELAYGASGLDTSKAHHENSPYSFQVIPPSTTVSIAKTMIRPTK